MKRWLISDTHLNHENIIRYCDRPFESKEAMNKHIIEKWNNTIHKDDIVYHLGDFAFADKETITKFVNRLRGRKRLILGNHDRKHSYQFWCDVGFERVYDHAIISDAFFILSHEPVFLSDWHDKPPEGFEYKEDGTINPVPQKEEELGLAGSNATMYINIHGHTHQNCYKNKHYINVSVENIDYTPVDMDALIKKILKGNEN